FLIYTDYFYSEPYYSYPGLASSVLVHRNGRLEVQKASNLFYLYRTRTYESDFSGIIEEIVDLNGAYNAVYRLLEE
ncbi:MAG: hypothetical protein IJJ45_08340, partial [Clostridia bacterium]|nr:hypothetical protein [Clostridia bacterium]